MNWAISMKCLAIICGNDICWDSTLSCKSKQVSLIHTCKSESVVCPLHAIPGILYSSPQNNLLLCKSSLLRIIRRICTKEMTSAHCVNSPIFTPRNSAALRTCVIPEKIGVSQCINYRTSTVISLFRMKKDAFKKGSNTSFKNVKDQNYIYKIYSGTCSRVRGASKKNLFKVGILSQPALGYSKHIIFFMKLWIMDLWCSSILRWSCLRMNAGFGWQRRWYLRFDFCRFANVRKCLWKIDKPHQYIELSYPITQKVGFCKENQSESQ